MLKRILFALFAFLSLGMAIAAVDINRAGEQELQALKGIGATKAKAIVQYRTENGPFKSIEDLRKVRGFGGKGAAFDKIKDQITVSSDDGKQKVAQPVLKEKERKVKEKVKTVQPEQK